MTSNKPEEKRPAPGTALAVMATRLAVAPAPYRHTLPPGGGADVDDFLLSLATRHAPAPLDFDEAMEQIRLRKGDLDAAREQVAEAERAYLDSIDALAHCGRVA